MYLSLNCSFLCEYLIRKKFSNQSYIPTVLLWRKQKPSIFHQAVIKANLEDVKVGAPTMVSQNAVKNKNNNNNVYPSL
jgi:hypothetical protein